MFGQLGFQVVDIRQFVGAVSASQNYGSARLGKEMEQIHHRASIAGYITGYITDAVTHQAISGVEVTVKVTLEGQALRPRDTKKVETHEDGFFYFLDLQDGQYDLSFLVPKESRNRYGGRDESHPTASVSGVLVTKDSNGKPSFDLKATLQLPPTSLSGQVISQDSNNPIPQAIVKLLGSEIQTLTKPDGNYFLPGLQAGNPTVQISAKGFVAITTPVTLTAGQETKLEKVSLISS